MKAFIFLKQISDYLCARTAFSRPRYRMYIFIKKPWILMDFLLISLESMIKYKEMFTHDDVDLFFHEYQA